MTDAQDSADFDVLGIRDRRPSPHQIDLKGQRGKGAKGQRDAEKTAVKKRKLPAKWQMLLDERIHLKEMRERRLSVRPRGWRDLPPSEATTLRQAVGITVSRFFNEHPLADLTVLMLLHTAVMLVWKALVLPAERLLSVLGVRTARTAAAPADLPMLPVAAAMPIPIRDERPDVVPRFGQLMFGRTSPRLRHAFAFAAVALALLVPLGAYNSATSLVRTRDLAIERGLAALQHLKDAGSAVRASDFFGAKSAFAMAGEEFGSVRDELGPLSGILAAAGAVLPSSSVSSAGLMLVTGEEISEAGRYLTEGLAALEGDASPADKMRALGTALDRALPHLERATGALIRLSPDAVPEEYRSFLDTAKIELPHLTDTVREGAQMAGFLSAVLGTDAPRRYLVVFQNDGELRATGGFIGSFALLDIDSGEVANLEIPGGGSYDLQGSLTERLVSPRPLHLINPHWEFQDANWSPDFPTSAARLARFYEKAGGPTVDGVIAVNSSVMERLLGLVGPVEMEEYDVTFDEDNFVDETQRLVEVDYDREENRPKQVIADLAPVMLERLTSEGRADYLTLVTTLDAALAAKEIQVWFRSPEMQSRAATFGWAGELKSNAGDYLQVVHSNVAGQKTDGVMDEEIVHSVKILADGSAIVTLEIFRAHNGIKGEPLTGVRNVDYLRIYVPLGSVLVEAQGFDIPDPKLFKIPEAGYSPDPEVAEREDNERLDRASGTRLWTERGKTVFGNWVQTDPGETSHVTLVYQLPPDAVEVREPDGGPLSDVFGQLTSEATGRRLAYGLLVQKQSGTNPPLFTSSVSTPRGFYLTWEDPEREEDERGRSNAAITLEGDKFFGLVAESAR
ncbi:DUF4012 domain-containing protein [Patescibacteria group bacterium]